MACQKNVVRVCGSSLPRRTVSPGGERENCAHTHSGARCRPSARSILHVGGGAVRWWWWWCLARRLCVGALLLLGVCAPASPYQRVFCPIFSKNSLQVTSITMSVPDYFGASVYVPPGDDGARDADDDPDAAARHVTR